MYIVGLGPGRGYVTELAVEAIAEADCVFYEDYTGPLDLETLEKKSRTRPIRLTRRQLEDESGRAVLDCLRQGKKAVLVTAGDPFVATAHASLAAEVKARGYDVVILPGVSIVCAAFSVSCLSVYKLGGVATVTYPRGGVYSTRPYELAELNLSRGLHTLLLLDVRDDGAFMTPAEAARILLELEERTGRGVFTPDRKVVVVHRLGWGGEVYYDELSKVAGSDVGGPAVLIVPAQLGPVERECLERLWARR